MDHEQLEESLSLYALGTLEPDPAREVESHLASGCPPCSALLRQYQGPAAMLPYALTLSTPPAGLKAKIMRAIAGPDAQKQLSALPLLDRERVNAYLDRARAMLATNPSGAAQSALRAAVLARESGAPALARHIRPHVRALAATGK